MDSVPQVEVTGFSVDADTTSRSQNVGPVAERASPLNCGPVIRSCLCRLVCAVLVLCCAPASDAQERPQHSGLAGLALRRRHVRYWRTY